ncbi:hypothetical protein Pmar_PMAR007372 [Perkinsus marinus ATCC 50983]|uniref:Uncharacterized protein n=1 Tax=Perkinsus marinus (strain ATCC 50983 / TXsc) TaxID=423536 RepID=C5K657_PERM5|nr:hypothetical protein Pmar_PMAR007372 [Perkinsus marinus ATCC 50983]EER20087.1 hypothetical protein Pmar_PMAR007372 [Perkinsus marinus ATCC 50983]|eukprot:XP_002788291.1 hypothetical protein Pmar_PMAR007372 [Perkinsus marinus ATCC 50983]
MSSSNVQSVLRSTGAQTPVDRLNMTLSDIIRMDGIQEPSDVSEEIRPDGELENADPIPRTYEEAPGVDQGQEQPTQEGNFGVNLDGGNRDLNSFPKIPQTFDDQPKSTLRSDRRQGQRMSELRKNVVKFSGTPKEDVEEWLDKLDMIAGPDGFNLNYHDQALLLRLSVSGDAYQAVLMVRPGDPKTDPQQKGYLARVRSELRKRFGKSPDRAINNLCDISFTNYDTVDEYATAINRLVRQTCPNTHRECQGEWKKIFFYRGLPHNFPASASIKPFCLDPTLTFEQVLEKARLYFDSNAEARVAAPGVRRSIGKGGKGRGKGKGRRSNHFFKQADLNKDKGLGKSKNAIKGKQPRREISPYQLVGSPID